MDEVLSKEIRKKLIEICKNHNVIYYGKLVTSIMILLLNYEIKRKP